MEIYTWMLNPQKFLSRQDAVGLLTTSKDRAERAYLKGQKVAIRDYFFIHLALATGLRVMEIAALNCGDLFLTDFISALLVRRGKGNRKRQVLFDGSLRKHCQEYLEWKQSVGESIEPDQPLFLSSNTKTYMTTRALEKAFKRCAQKAGISPSYSIHSLRHTFACLLLEASDWNMRFVQKQLGHTKIETTEIYAQIMSPAIQNTLSSFNNLIQIN